MAVSEDTKLDVGNYGSTSNSSEAPPWRWRSVVLAVVGQWCCFLCGVPAVVASIISYTDHRQGDYASYRQRKRWAIKLAIAAIITGIIVLALQIAWIMKIQGKVNHLFATIFDETDSSTPS